MYVDGRAGERHRGVQRERQSAGPEDGVEDLDAVPPRGVHDQLAGAYGAGLGEALDQAGQGVVRHGQEHQFGPLEDFGRRHQGNVGQQLGGPAHRGLGDAGRGDGAVPREFQRGGERGADPARADDPYGEPGRAVLRLLLLGYVHATTAFRSSPLGVPDDFSSC